MPNFKLPWGLKYGNPFQYSCLENSMDRGAWRATVPLPTHRAGHDWATKRMHTHTHTHTLSLSLSLSNWGEAWRQHEEVLWMRGRCSTASQGNTAGVLSYSQKNGQGPSPGTHSLLCEEEVSLWTIKHWYTCYIIQMGSTCSGGEAKKAQKEWD